MTINERFNFLMKELKFNPNSFSKEIGVSQSSLRQIIEGDNLPSAKVLIPLVDKMPYVNLNWLIGGKGEMFLNESTSELAQLKKEVETLRNTLADKEEIIRLLKNSK